MAQYVAGFEGGMTEEAMTEEGMTDEGITEEGMTDVVETVKSGMGDDANTVTEYTDRHVGTGVGDLLRLAGEGEVHVLQGPPAHSDVVSEARLAVGNCLVI